MTYKRRFFFNSIILFLAAVTVGNMILTATNSLARGRGGGYGGGGSVRHSGRSSSAMAHAKSEGNYWEEKYVNEKEYNRQSAAIGSVHNSGEIIYLPPPPKTSPRLGNHEFSSR